MFLRRTGMPEEGEILLVTITKIYHHSVFCTLDEYGGQSGMIHISEIAPGRIRNLRDYVTEGKKVIVKILKINMEKRHIDLSLRRVSQMQRKAKNEQIKQEQKAEKIIELVAKELKKDAKQVYDKVAKVALEQYDFLHEAFMDVVTGELELKSFKLDAKLDKTLTDMIKLRIKPQEVSIKGALSLTSYADDGVNVVKSALKEAESKGNEKTSIRYLGGGRYNVEVQAPDYKEAEATLKKMVDAAISAIEKADGVGTFARKDGKAHSQVSKV